MATVDDEMRNAIITYLNSKSLYPTIDWLSNFLSTTRPNTPLPALKQTALFRLLASDITTSLVPSPTTVFPADIHDANIRERHLSRLSIPVQILDIEDLSRSRWSQVEAIESAEKGETTKGREVIRVVPGEEGLAGESRDALSKGQHKLLLQDAKGTQVYGFELSAVEGVNLAMSIGAKLLLTDVLVARGVVMMEPRTVTLLGGKIEALQKEWREGRKQALKDRIT
ncbi:MAG: hypothetical protein M1820_007630 [Bogoriella megaspora]|nr:MAG: hypothetical protein M1820_007630 [Bogoriella megaspora]